MRMKLLYYYLQILSPIAVIVMLYEAERYQSSLIAILVYMFVYRPVVDSWRLTKLGVLAKKERWKMFIPFYRSKYFEVLYFNQAL